MKKKEIKITHRNIRPYFGAKCKLSRELIKYFPKNIAELIFIDVFTGGGSMALLATQLFKKVIANDIDSNVINMYQFMKSAQLFGEFCNNRLQLENKMLLQSRFKELDNTFTIENAYNTYCCSYSNYGGKTYTTPSTVKVDTLLRRDNVKFLNGLKDYLSKIEFLNKDYKEVLIYKNAFYYLDPPYWKVKSDKYYGLDGENHKNFNHYEFKEQVDKIAKHSYIMVSYEDSPEIRELYKDYKIHRILNKGGKKDNKTGKGVAHNTWEVIITNY